MGLGKTVQTMALMCANPPAEGEPCCTLIVAPVSVMGTWENHLRRHVKEDVFDTMLLEGSDYKNVTKLIKKKAIDVVIMSYARLVSIMNKYPKFFECVFHRVVCDEAHEFRSRTSKNFEAV